MSSILTNTSAMVALQTLKTINGDLQKTQNAISTGKDIASAKDNSAIWAISKVMESDVVGFQAVSDSLSLGESTVAVALAGAEQITNVLNEIKGKVVAATGENVDYTKLTADVSELVNQVTSIISASQFNGANLLNAAGAAGLTVLSSLDRDALGNVTASNITVASVNFETNLDLSDIDVSSGAAADASIAAIEAHTRAGSGSSRSVHRRHRWRIPHARRPQYRPSALHRHPRGNRCRFPGKAYRSGGPARPSRLDLADRPEAPCRFSG